MDKVLKRYRIQRWQPDEGVLLHATIIGQFVSHADHVASTEAMRKALEAARDFIAVVECDEGLTTDNLLAQIDAALAARAAVQGTERR